MVWWALLITIGILILVSAQSIYSRRRSHLKIHIFRGIMAFALIEGLYLLVLYRSNLIGLNPELHATEKILMLVAVALLLLLLACLFIGMYVIAKAQIQSDIIGPYTSWLSWALVFFCAATAVMHSEQRLTSLNLSLLAIVLTTLIWVFRPMWLGRFITTWIVFQIPYLLISNMLIGWPGAHNVIWLNRADLMGIYIGSAPFEVVFHNMFIYLCVISTIEIPRRLNSSTYRAFSC